MTRLAVIHSAPVWLPRTQTWMHQQVRGLPAWVESHVVCERTENKDQLAVPHLHALADGPRWRLWCDRAARALGLRHHLGHLPRVARAVDARVLHSHFGHIGWLDLGAARAAGLAHVVTFYGQDVQRLPRQEPRWRARYHELFARVDRVLCEGPHMAGCIAALGCPESKIRVHRLGVDTLALVPRPRPRGGTLRVLLCATFTAKKGLPDAIAALGRLASRVPLTVTLVGDAGPSPLQQQEKERILAAIARFGLEDRVRLRGWCTHAEVLALAYEHDVFLQPSVTAADGDTEGGAPVVLTELAATGLPVVATRHCDIPDVVIDGEGAMLADEHDVEGLAACLQQVWRDPERAYALARQARARIEALFDRRRQGQALAAIYAEVAGIAVPEPAAVPDEVAVHVG